MLSKLLLSPNCPMCGQPPALLLLPAFAMCGTISCLCVKWDPTKSAEENLRDQTSIELKITDENVAELARCVPTSVQTGWPCAIDENGERANRCAEARERMTIARCLDGGCKRCYPHSLACRCGTPPQAKVIS